MAASDDDKTTQPCIDNNKDDTKDATKNTTPKKLSVQIVDPPVTEVYNSPSQRESGYTILKVEEKHGPLYWAIPTMPLPLAIICCIFNILVPGFGTLISSFTVFCCGGYVRSGSSACRAFALNIVSAVLQMLTFILIVGWIWSILWGMTFVQFALATSSTGPPTYYVRRQSSL